MNAAKLLPLSWRTLRLLRSQWWGAAQIQSYQRHTLRKALRHATENIPHYRDLGLDRSNDPFEWLAKFPTLTKGEVQSAGDRLRANSNNVVFSSDSSGSTGESVRTFFDENAWQLTRYALKARRILNATRSLRQRFISIAERADDSSESISTLSAYGHLFAHEYVFVDDDLANNAARLVDFQPTLLYGFPSYMRLLANSIKKDGKFAPQVPTIFTSSETLTQPLRDDIERDFRGRIYDIYGSTEFKEIAVQCDYGRYHINFESTFVEHAPDPVLRTSRLLVTSLINREMPLIRYDIGDFGNVSVQPCACGREGPFLTELAGRKAESLRFSDGSVVMPYPLYTTLDRYAEIRNFQLTRQGDDELRVLIYSDGAMVQHRVESLKRELMDQLPNVATVEISQLEQRLPEGKRVAIADLLERNAHTSGAGRCRD